MLAPLLWIEKIQVMLMMLVYHQTSLSLSSHSLYLSLLHTYYNNDAIVMLNFFLKNAQNLENKNFQWVGLLPCVKETEFFLFKGWKIKVGKWG